MQENIMIRRYPLYFVATLAYAVFYTICLYHNGSGITYPLFTAGTLVYFVVCLQQADIHRKKNSLWYFAAIELLGISNCLTGDERILFLNKLGIFLLLLCFLLHTVYNDSKWNFTKYCGAVITTLVLSLSCIARPVADALGYRGTREHTDTGMKKQVKYVLLGLAVCIPVLLVVLPLLVSADAVFESMFHDLFRGLSLNQTIIDAIRVILLTVCVFFFAYMLVAYLLKKEIREEVEEHAVHEPVIAITAAVVLSVVYLVFCGIQVVYLFFGASGALTLPDGMTYSQYAREGFFQLLFVCLINLVIVLCGMYLFRENKTLKLLLTVITGCTCIMTISSALRMILYIQYQYLTFLRLFVLWSLAVISLLLIGVFVAIWKKAFPLFGYGMVVVTVCYLLLSFSHVDYWIAKVNTANMSQTTQWEFFKDTEVYADMDFLSMELSTDAFPAFITEDDMQAYAKWKNGNGYQEYLACEERLEEWSEDYDEDLEAYDRYRRKNWKNIYLMNIENKAAKVGIRNWNLSRAVAKKAFAEVDR